MNNLTDEAQVYFRLLHLDKFQAYSLVHEIRGSSHKVNEASNHYAASIPLTQQNFEDINDYYIRQRIALESCDILISISSQSGGGTIDIPNIVNRMLKYIDCKLTFSFTAV